MNERSRRLRALVAYLRRAGAVEPVAVGLAGSEPLWPIFAESARLLSPLRGFVPRPDLLDLFSDQRSYVELLTLLRDVHVDVDARPGESGVAPRECD